MAVKRKMAPPFAAGEARARVRRWAPDPTTSRRHPLHAGRLQIEFFAADAATWQNCERAFREAFPIGSGLQGDPETGIFELPASRGEDLQAWLAASFEAPVEWLESRPQVRREPQAPRRSRNAPETDAQLSPEERERRRRLWSGQRPAGPADRHRPRR